MCMHWWPLFGNNQLILYEEVFWLDPNLLFSHILQPQIFFFVWYKTPTYLAIYYGTQTSFSPFLIPTKTNIFCWAKSDTQNQFFPRKIPTPHTHTQYRPWLPYFVLLAHLSLHNHHQDPKLIRALLMIACMWNIHLSYWHRTNHACSNCYHRSFMLAWLLV